MTSRRIAFLVGCVAVVSLQVGACGGGGGGNGKDDDHGEMLENAECQTITDACHHVAEASGKPAECHDIAHEDEAAPCRAQLAACVAACEAEEHE